jgi:hypothetical protein
MLGWLKRKFDGTPDLERFITSLRGMSAPELGALVAVATVVRINMRNAGHLPDGALAVAGGLPPEKQLAAQLKMTNLVRQFQQLGQPSDAAGAMVWTHSMRAGATPELRLLGRQMWGELSRGFAHAAQAIEDIVALSPNSLPPELTREYRFIPPGLEPAVSAGLTSSGELRAITSAALADIKAKWVQFDSTVRLKADLPLSVKIDAFVEPISKFVEGKYPTLMRGPAEAFWLTVFTAILESGTHAKDDVNRALGEVKKKYGPR